MLDEYLTISITILKYTPFIGWSEEMWSGNKLQIKKTSQDESLASY